MWILTLAKSGQVSGNRVSKATKGELPFRRTTWSPVHRDELQHVWLFYCWLLVVVEFCFWFIAAERRNGLNFNELWFTIYISSVVQNHEFRYITVAARNCHKTVKNILLEWVGLYLLNHPTQIMPYIICTT